MWQAANCTLCAACIRTGHMAKHEKGGEQGGVALLGARAGTGVESAEFMLYPMH